MRPALVSLSRCALCRGRQTRSGPESRRRAIAGLWLSRKPNERGPRRSVHKRRHDQHAVVVRRHNRVAAVPADQGPSMRNRLATEPWPRKARWFARGDRDTSGDREQALARSGMSRRQPCRHIAFVDDAAGDQEATQHVVCDVHRDSGVVEAALDQQAQSATSCRRVRRRRGRACGAQRGGPRQRPASWARRVPAPERHGAPAGQPARAAHRARAWNEDPAATRCARQRRQRQCAPML